MFERQGSGGVAAADAPTDASTLSEWMKILGDLGRPGPQDSGLGDAECVEALRTLEELKAAAAAAQARVSVALDAARRSQRAKAGVRAADQGKGVASEVALARRESPTRGAQHLGLAKTLVAEMPHGLAALSSGLISEWRATLVARETACLSVEHRSHIDRMLFGDPDRLTQVEFWGDGRLVAETRKIAYRLDPQAALARVRKAESDRRVTCRPAPDTMAYLSALLPVAQAVACYAALNRAAETARAAGDPRSRGQVMADTMVELLTGQKIAAGTPVEIQLVVTDQTLFANMPNRPADPDRPNQPDPDQPDPDQPDPDQSDPDQSDDADIDAEQADPEEADPDDSSAETDPRDEPAYVPGYGPVRAAWARRLIAELPDATRTWIRRVFTHPITGELVAMDSKRREFPAGIRHALVLRDQTCATPWCDAPIRHADHVLAHTEGGPTSLYNGQGLCEACNYTKQAAGWTARPGTDSAGHHIVDLTTPTGHTYTSTAPSLPGARAPDQAPARAAPRRTRLEIYLTDLILEYAA